MGKKITITPAMIDAGVRVYRTPGRHETYAQSVARIFRAMMKASPGPDEAICRDMIDAINAASKARNAP